MKSLHHRLDWLRRSFNRVSIVEIVIVAIVLVILLLAVFPSFERAQIQSGIAKTRQSLTTLTNALMVYNLENQQNKLKWIRVYSYNLHVMVVPYYEKDKKKSSIFPSHHDDEFSIDFLGLTPDRVYHKQTELISSLNQIENVEVNSFHIFNEATDWVYFTFNGPTGFFPSTSPLPYRGVTPGPFIDNQIDEWFIKTSTTVSPAGNRILLYEPSNGLLSHGYLIYEAIPTSSSLSSASNSLKEAPTP